MPPAAGSSRHGAGQTIIEGRYERMARGRRHIRFSNHLATAATIIFLTAQLRAREGSGAFKYCVAQLKKAFCLLDNQWRRLSINDVPGAESFFLRADVAQLAIYELMLGFAEVTTWLMTIIGQGYGRVSREKEWLLRSSMLMSAFSLVLQVLNLNPSRLIGAWALLADQDAPGYSLQAMGIVAQLVALGSRLNVMRTGMKLLKDKRASLTKSKTK